MLHSQQLLERQARVLAPFRFDGEVAAQIVDPLVERNLLGLEDDAAHGGGAPWLDPPPARCQQLVAILVEAHLDSPDLLLAREHAAPTLDRDATGKSTRQLVAEHVEEGVEI